MSAFAMSTIDLNFNIYIYIYICMYVDIQNFKENYDTHCKYLYKNQINKINNFVNVHKTIVTSL